MFGLLCLLGLVVDCVAWFLVTWYFVVLFSCFGVVLLVLVFVFGSVCLVCQLALACQFVFACGLRFDGCLLILLLRVVLILLVWISRFEFLFGVGLVVLCLVLRLSV